MRGCSSITTNWFLPLFLRVEVVRILCMMGVYAGRTLRLILAVGMLSSGAHAITACPPNDCTITADGVLVDCLLCPACKSSISIVDR